MKFVFFVHSYITYYLSKAVIKKKNYSPKDCIFFLHRNFKMASIDLGSSLDFPFDFYPLDSFPIFNKWWKGASRLEELDRFIFAATGGNNYHFFTPQSRAKMFQLIKTNKLCKGYSYIEEGTLSYWELDRINQLHPPRIKSTRELIKMYLNYKGRLSKNEAFYDLSYSKVYGVSEESFPGFKNKEIVQFEVQKKKYGYQNILVFDALVEQKMINFDTLYLSLIVLCNYLKSEGINEIHFKFHPTQYKVKRNTDNLRLFLKFLDSKIKFIELPMEASLEEIAFNSSADFYIFISSLGIYASMAGRRVFSLIEVIRSFEPDFKFSLDSLPPLFKNKIMFLPEIKNS